MEPRIETISPKKVVGKCLRMTLKENRTRELWSSFMPVRKNISNAVGGELISMQVYEEGSGNVWNPETPFKKWAVAEVEDFSAIPQGMEAMEIPAGLYAVFLHKGAAQTGPEAFRFIFGTWLPASEYVLDTRPHFEVLGEKYRNDHPDSEEEIWIPIRKKPVGAN